MKQISLFFLLLIFSCSNEDDQSPSGNLFHITYGYAQDIEWNNPGIISFGEEQLLVLNVRLGSDDNTDYAIGLTMVDAQGAVKWSKQITSDQDKSIMAFKLEKTTDNEFVILARSGSWFDIGPPVTIRLSTDGNIISSEIYERVDDDWLRFTEFAVMSDGSYLFSGITWPYVPVMVHSGLNQTVDWSFTTNGGQDYGATVASGNDFIKVIPSGNALLLCKATLENEVIWKKRLDVSGASLSIRKVLRYGDNIIIAASHYTQSSEDLYLIKVSPDGTVSKIKRAQFERYADITTNGTDLFVAFDGGNDNKLCQLNGDLNVTNQKYIDRFFSANQSLSGTLSTTPTRIVFLLGPIQKDPAYGRRGVNLVTIEPNKLSVSCDVTQTEVEEVQFEEMTFTTGDYEVTKTSLPLKVSPYSLGISDITTEETIVCGLVGR